MRIDLRHGIVERGLVRTALLSGTAEHDCIYCREPIPHGFLHFHSYSRDPTDPWNFSNVWEYRMHIACHVDFQAGRKRPVDDVGTELGPADTAAALAHNRDARAYFRLHGLSPWTGHPCGPAQSAQEDEFARMLGLPGACAITLPPAVVATLCDVFAELV